MGSLREKLICETVIKSNGDVFHQLFKEEPHHISVMSPDEIQNCDFHQVGWATIGSIIYWKYFHARLAKDIIEYQKSVTFKVEEGDLMGQYKMMIISVEVDTNEEDNVVTWTIDYVKQNEQVGAPLTLLGVCNLISKDIGAHNNPK